MQINKKNVKYYFGASPLRHDYIISIPRRFTSGYLYSIRSGFLTCVVTREVTAQVKSCAKPIRRIECYQHYISEYCLLFLILTVPHP